MKKVLIVANLFYASPRISGLAKYLPEFGWDPIILTVPLGDSPDEQFGPPNDFREKNRVIETYGYTSRKDLVTSARKQIAFKKSLRFLRPLLRFLYRRYTEIVHYPDAEKYWRPIAYNAASEFLKSEHVDAVISSSSPVTTHIIAHDIKKTFHIPWIADFRDLWTQNHNYPYTILRRVFEKRLELRTLATADALVTVSLPLAEKLMMLHKGKNAYAVTSGFDPEKMSDGKVDLTTEFTITYTGQIYEKQDPSKLLVVLRDLVFEKAIDPKDVSIRFYGPENLSLAKKIEEYGLSTFVAQRGVVSREISLEKQRESQLLLLLSFEDKKEKGLISGKVFEYLAARRPILVTGGFGDDVVEKLIDETNSGIYCSKTEDIKKALRKTYSEYKSYRKVNYEGRMEKINKYTYREMARRFAEILNNLSEERQSL